MSRHFTVTNMCPIPYVDFQSFLSVLTQISPAVETLGWKILVANQPDDARPFIKGMYAYNDRINAHFGGAAGNSSVKLNLTLK